MSKAETMWGIAHKQHGLIYPYNRKTRSDAIEAATRNTEMDWTALRSSGYRAVKLAVSYEVPA